MTLRAKIAVALIIALIPLLFHNCTLIESQEFDSSAIISIDDFEIAYEKNPNLKLFQVSKEDIYNKAHLESARQLYRNDIQIDKDGYGGIAANRDSIAALLSSHGISSTDRIFLYDELGNVNACRFWWLLRYYGHENVTIIDGGLVAWVKKGNPTVTGNQLETNATSYQFPQEAKTEYIAETEFIKNGLSTGEFILLDTRSREEFEGSIMKKGASRAGRIPGSILIDYHTLVDWANPIGPLFKTKEELSSIFSEKGIDKEQQIITYCQTGVRSALSYFVLQELLGYPDIKNYDGSWVEWSYYAELPIEKDSTSQD